MAYKRYINKKGKRHGPYYYKNVRDESGKVKSIYLGKVTARGKRPLEVAIVFLAVLLIIISALFFIQNRNLVLSQIAAEEAAVPFEIDQILIKVLVKANEFIGKELRVMNVGSKEQTITVEAIGISDIVNVLDKEFTIKPGQTKIVRLNLSSFDRIKGIEQAPGVYIGKILAKTDSFQKEVPVVVEIESKNVLFDMNLNPVARDRRVVQGSSTTFEIRVFNLQSIDSFNVDMDFFVKDINGNTIISESESVVVKTQASFFKTLRVPEKLKTGNYVFVAQASLGNSVGTASYLFEVEEVAKEQRVARFIGFCRDDPLCWALSIIVLLLLFAIGAYGYFFIGALIYQKLLGIRIPRTKKAEEVAVEERLVVEKEENPIISSFKHLGESMRRTRERRAKKKLEFEKQRLELEEEKEKIKLELEERKAKFSEEGRRKREEEKRRKRLEKKENHIAKFFRDWMNKGKRAREIRFRRKLEHEREKLKLEEEKEKLKIRLRGEGRKENRKRVFEIFHDLGLVKTKKEKRDIENRKLQLQAEKEKLRIELQGEREKLKERQFREREKILEIKKKRKTEEEKREEGRKGLVGKCRKLIDIGYKALDKNDVKKADKIYTKLMGSYIKLSGERKVEIFKEINSYYKSLLLKKQQLKQKEETDKRKQEKIKKEEDAAKRKKQEKKLIEKERREKLGEEIKKGRRKKVFNFFHGLGLVKTKKEKRKIERQKESERKSKKLEKERKLEQKRKRELEEERQRQRELEKKRAEEERIEAEEEERRAVEERKKDVENKRQRELERIRAEEEKRLREKKVFDFFHYLGLVKTEEEEIRKQKEMQFREFEKKKKEERERQKELEKKREREFEEKRKEEEDRERELEEERQRELERKRKVKLREGRKKGRRKKVFKLFHGLGLVKTKKEKREIERRRQEEEKRKLLEEQRQRELEKKRAEEERIEEEERQREQEKITKKKLREKKVFDFFHDLGLVKTEEEEKEEEIRKQKEMQFREFEKKKKEDEIKRKKEDGERKQKEREFREFEKKKKEDEIKRKKEEERKRLEIEEKRGLIGKCRRVIDKGYRALDSNNVKKADRLYVKLMEEYMDLSSERKVEIFKEINSYYKSLLIKKQQLKQKEEAGKRKQEKKLIEKERREKLGEEIKKGRRKKVFKLFHGLGLVKTKKEKGEIERRKARERKGKELEKKRKLEQKRKRELEEERQRELERKRREEEKERQRQEEEKRKLLEEERQREQEKIAKREQAEEEKRRVVEERKKELEEGRQRELERERVEEGRIEAEEEERQRQEEEKKREKEERKKELEDEIQRREDEGRQRELERERVEEGRIEAEEKKKKQLEIKKREEEKRKLEESELERKESERRKKQAQRENRLNAIKELEQGIKEKDAKISKIKEKIKDAYSEGDSIAKDISKIEKDIEGIKNEKKMLFKVYNEGVGSRKQLSEERKNRLAEWKQRYDAKLKEKSGIKDEIKQEYGNELKELENELQGLSNKDRKDQEKWKKLELKAKHKLEEHEREKGVNEDLKRILTEKKDIEEEFKQKRMGLGKGIEGRDIMQKQKELNDHIIEYEKDIEELNKDIKSEDRSLDRYESNIEELEEEKNKAENALLDKKKELGGINYFTSIFKFAVRTKPVKKQVESKERLIQKKDAEEEKEIKQEEIEEQEAEDQEAEKELQKSLIELGKISKKIKQEDARKPGIIDRFFKHGEAEEAKVKPKHIEKEKAAYIEIKKKLKGKSRLFVKCHKLLLKAGKELQNNNAAEAKKLYSKTRKVYIKLGYFEKKEMYHELTGLYNNLKR